VRRLRALMLGPLRRTWWRCLRRLPRRVGILDAQTQRRRHESHGFVGLAAAGGSRRDSRSVAGDAAAGAAGDAGSVADAAAAGASTSGSSGAAGSGVVRDSMTASAGALAAGAARSGCGSGRSTSDSNSIGGSSTDVADPRASAIGLGPDVCAAGSIRCSNASCAAAAGDNGAPVVAGSPAGRTIVFTRRGGPSVGVGFGGGSGARVGFLPPFAGTGASTNIPAVGGN
jgi:hypothetical protein